MEFLNQRGRKGLKVEENDVKLVKALTPVAIVTVVVLAGDNSPYLATLKTIVGGIIQKWLTR